MRLVLADIDAAELERTSADLRGRGATATPVAHQRRRCRRCRAPRRRGLRAGRRQPRLPQRRHRFRRAELGALARRVDPRHRRQPVGCGARGPLLRPTHAGVRRGGPRADHRLDGVADGEARDRAPDTVAKHGVLGLGETLARELDDAGAPIGVSIVFPGRVATSIGGASPHGPDVQTPEQVAARALDAVRGNELFVLTHADRGGRRPHPARRDHREGRTLSASPACSDALFIRSNCGSIFGEARARDATRCSPIVVPRWKGTTMQADDLILVSVDDHLVEPPDLFEGRIPAKYARPGAPGRAHARRRPTCGRSTAA